MSPPTSYRTSETVTRSLEQAHLRERKPKSGTKNDAKESQPAESQFNGSWEAVEWLGDEGAPDRGNRLAYDRVGDKPKGNDPENVTAN
jgi:hypothetical protein